MKWRKTLNRFAQSDTGQFYWQLCKATGLTMRQLGEVKRGDPELYRFMEQALSEENRRWNRSWGGTGKGRGRKISSAKGLNKLKKRFKNGGS